jgi:hypothetical protein
MKNDLILQKHVPGRTHLSFVSRATLIFRIHFFTYLAKRLFALRRGDKQETKLELNKVVRLSIAGFFICLKNLGQKLHQFENFQFLLIYVHSNVAHFTLNAYTEHLCFSLQRKKDENHQMPLRVLRFSRFLCERNFRVRRKCKRVVHFS